MVYGETLRLLENLLRDSLSIISEANADESSNGRPQRRSELEWDQTRPRLYQLYIVQKKSLNVVMEMMENSGFMATKPMYLHKFQKWGYHKNTTRSAAFQTLREDREPLTADAKRKTHAYIHRNRLDRPGRRLSSVNSPSNNPDHFLTTSLNQISDTEVLSICLKIQNLVSRWVSKSFGEGIWSYWHSDRLIESSELQSNVKFSLHSFLLAIEVGCERALSGEIEAAHKHWDITAKEIEGLVNDTYHDILPASLRKLSDLTLSGFDALATKLIRSMAQSARKGQPSDCKEIYILLQRVPLQTLPDLVERVMEHYNFLFAQHLGLTCYNSYVTLIDYAQERLERNPQLALDDYLPSLLHLDSVFGIFDRRSMDVLRVKATVFFKRNEYQNTILTSRFLIDRAQLCENDVWIRLYFSLIGYYLLSSAEMHLHRLKDARENMFTFLRLQQDFEQLPPGYLFQCQKIQVFTQLEKLFVQSEDLESAAMWRSMRNDDLDFLQMSIDWTE